MGMGQFEIPSPCEPMCLFFCLCAGLKWLPDLDLMRILHDFCNIIEFLEILSWETDQRIILYSTSSSSSATYMRPETQVVVGKTSHFFLFRTSLYLLFMIQDHFAICLSNLFINFVFIVGTIKKKN